MLLSANPARRAVERWWLIYTPIWGAIAGLVMLSGLAEGWGDLELMIFGAALFLGAVVPPLARPHESEREMPTSRRPSVQLCLAIVSFSFLMNYFQTPYFFDVLHMHYGFGAELTIEHNPVFLYLVTVAYFATYLVLVSIAYRLAASQLPSKLSWLGGGLAAFGVAGLETALNANPFMGRLFCFDDLPFMLWFGTLSYGLSFVFILPVWITVGEREAKPLRWLAAGTLIAALALMGSQSALRHFVAPHFTDVEPGAENLRDVQGSCLEPIPE